MVDMKQHQNNYRDRGLPLTAPEDTWRKKQDNQKDQTNSRTWLMTTVTTLILLTWFDHNGAEKNEHLFI